MSSDTTAKESSNLFTCCLKCFPQKLQKQPQQTYPDFLATRYNAQAAATENHLPERPLQRSPQLSPRVEYDPSGRVTIEPQPAHLTPRNSSQSTQGQLSPAAAQQPQSTFRMRAERRFPVTNADDPRENWSKAVLDAHQLAELFETIHKILAHVPYVICGLAALVDHGFTARRVSRVSLLCPAYAKDNVRAWLAARGYDTFADSVGIPIADGAVMCRVRVKYTDEGFDGLERVRSSVSQAWVLGLASQIDNAAAGYVDHWRRLRKLEDEGGSSEDQGKIEKAMQTIARDIFWCLDKAAKTRHWLDPRLLQTLLGEEFWAPFTERNDNARTEMARAGIDVAGVLSRHRADEAIRDHNDMLKEYGLEGDNVITRQPSPFEGMQTLAHSHSIYTLKQSRGSDTVPADDLSIPPVVSALPSPRFPRSASSQQQHTTTTASKGKTREKFLESLLPKRLGSTRGGRSKDSNGKHRARSLSRIYTIRSQSKDSSLATPSRSSEDTLRQPKEWI
ncbi:hypothetical protein F4776DRAFT_622845 [Hypoxylon sp. NC0597]|nr:hypothetical protein F4776DRAFT_622845 [Hypoxylon sp. NC0597]